MGRLEAKFSPSFQRDLKKKATRRGWDLSELERLVGLIIENSPSSLEELRRRHNMHSLQGKWAGHLECHVANAGDLLVIWTSDSTTALLERTGSHAELFN